MNVSHGRRIRWIALGAAALAATAAATSAAATSAVAQPASVRAQPTPIRHVVVLYLENHSFDSLLGFWCDINHRCPDGGMPSSVTLSNGQVVHPTGEPDVVPNVTHTVVAQQEAIDGGRMDGWWQISGCKASSGYRCIGGYEPNQIPNLAQLADQFAISDATFSMADSPSWGGHLYAAMASLDGFTGDNPKPAPGEPRGLGWGCNSNRIAQWAPSPNAHLRWVPSCVPDPSLNLAFGGAFEKTPVQNAPSIMDSLDQAGLSWRIYGQPTPSKQNGYVWDICPSIAQCLDTSQHNNNVPSTQFTSDASSGNLPAFSIVTPGGPDSFNSEHNGFSMTAGDNWLGSVASSIMNGPDWNSTVLFISWDDCGCFYDQVPPGMNPDGSAQGPRVPLVIVSPFARHAFTDNTPATFASILAFTERNFGLQPLSENDARAYAFQNAFNFGQRPLSGVHMVNRPVPKSDHIKYWEARQGT
jgi:phospholipase C